MNIFDFNMKEKEQKSSPSSVEIVDELTRKQQ